MDAPLVFISYSHDSDQHKAWVLRLATDLRTIGVDATLDQWDLALGQDMAAFMQRGITESSRVILVCTDTYVRKAEAGSGGVGYERLIVTAELVQNIDTKKFIPAIRNNPTPNKVPQFLGPRVFIDFSKDDEYQTKLEQLLREIFGVPSAAKNLYSQLGVAPETRLSVRVVHRGLAGRQLTSSSPNRHIWPSATQEDQSEAEIVTILGQIRPDLVENVRRITEPLFMLFDFKEFAEGIYRDIVRRFEAGEVT